MLLIIRKRFIKPNVCSIDDRYHPWSLLYSFSSSLNRLLFCFLIGVMIVFTRFWSQYALSPRMHSLAASCGVYMRYNLMSDIVPKCGPDRKHGADECRHIICTCKINKVHLHQCMQFNCIVHEYTLSTCFLYFPLYKYDCKVESSGRDTTTGNVSILPESIDWKWWGIRFVISWRLFQTVWSSSTTDAKKKMYFRIDVIDVVSCARMIGYNLR